MGRRRKAKPFPPIWKGGECFIIGGGPSLKGFDFSPIHDRRVIGVNNAFKLGAWVDACWWGDTRWRNHNFEELSRFPGLRVCCDPDPKDIPGIFFFLRSRSRISKGLDPVNGRVFWNGNSGVSAINFAFHTGAHRVILLGFDMKFGGESKTERNYHNEHTWAHPKKEPYTRYLEFLKDVPIAIKRINDNGRPFEVLNAGPDSEIPDSVFKKVRLEDVL